LTILVLIFLGLLLLTLGALYAFQRSLIYFPRRLTSAQFTDAVQASAGGKAAILAPFDAIVMDPPADIAVRANAILFHGNAALGIDQLRDARAFAQRGIRLILAEYPGYGPRAGAPTERSIVDDGCALYDAVLKRYPGTPIMLVGESLGSGAAVQVAARHPVPPARLVLITPFLSLAETAARVYPFLPARHLVKDRFDSARTLPRYRGPVAILVAGNDEVVGADQGRSLAEISRARGPSLLLELPLAGHNSWTALMTDGQWTDLLGFPSEVRHGLN
jgi:pimeloyl-ACP methyl ester carboxylesterase